MMVTRVLVACALLCITLLTGVSKAACDGNPYTMDYDPNCPCCTGSYGAWQPPARPCPPPLAGCTINWPVYPQGAWGGFSWQPGNFVLQAGFFGDNFWIGGALVSDAGCFGGNVYYPAPVCPPPVYYPVYPTHGCWGR